MKKATWVLIVSVLWTAQTKAETDPLTATMREADRLLKGFAGAVGNAIAKQAMKGTALDQDRNKPVVMKKSLRECIKKPNVIDAEVFQCMRGE